ncbi:LysR family transcriptional regulator [Reyranella sp. MMS21-HV4-11]|uniref:LysR family transcriptional regulator n=1 Tax=Reyranella humidisoli TaxID=2849149 RepID=A0ABS6IRG9_9HYPH|nr:LysR family transcriptional regulator [Reyranella sp. MMS21-HV4-11]
MKLQALRLFLRVMELGSLAAAAKSLNISQSAASRLLSGLEHGTGLRLFHRDRMRLVPTPEGTSFFAEVRRVLMAVDDLPRVARRVAGGTRVRLRIVSMPRFAASLLAPAVAHFHRLHPEVEVEVAIVHRRELELAVANQSFDLGIGALPLHNPGIDSQPLLDLPAVVVLPAGHPLARRKSLGARDLAAESVIVLGADTQLRHDVEAMFAAEGIALHPKMVVDSLEFACRLVSEGAGVTVADSLTPVTLGVGKLAVVPWRPRILFHVGVLLPALMPPSHSVEQFLDGLRRVARRLGGRLSRA